MANFEEKILGYLDGSLSEADREDVLAGISGERANTPERALFDAHLRLQELYSVVRTPVSAPLSVQRELASQVPLLAIKLPYLAPAERRDRAAAGWLSYIRSSWVNVFLIFSSVLLLGGVWYAVNTNASNGTPSSVTNPITIGSFGGGLSGAASNSAPQNISPANIATSSSTASGSSTRGTVVTHPIGSSIASTVSNSSPSSRSKLDRMDGSYSNWVSSRSTSAHRSGSADRLSNARYMMRTRQNASANKTPASTESIPQTATPPSQANAPAGVNAPTTPEEPPALPPLTLHSIDVQEKAIGFDPQHAMPIGSELQDNSSSFEPLHVYASGGSRYLIPLSKITSHVIEAKQGVTGNTMVPSSEVGAEYEFTPWTSAGVHIGWTNFAQYQSIAYTGSASALPKEVLDVDVVAVPAVWSALAVTQTFNPQDRARYSLSLAGGPAFTQPMGWLGMIEANLTYDLSSTLMFRGGVSYDIAQLKQSTQSPNVSSNSTTGIIVASNGGTLLSNAFGVTLGITFRP